MEKLKLDELKVKSFVTVMGADRKKNIAGGYAITPVESEPICTPKNNCPDY